ncbi:MAG: chlorophyllase, partial [Clostridiales bacterium]|nr:chlorophyllase [Clostridiales bacterium]
QKNCPVLFIVHGNHDYTVDSYLGYDYLGEYLSSYGYVVISVNENSCNDLSDENDGRAVLLLENMKYILELNKDETSEWYQKINEDKIAIAGHSRGGETVSTAYLFNDYDCYPENGNVKFDYHFDIKSLIAIAPTVDQYQPAEHEVSIQDVNYLVLQGANDHDVSIAMGQKQYDNVTFTQDGNYLKSLVYIANANHGQFNTEWGRYDYGYPINDFLNVANLMEESAQQEILKTFLKTFLDVTLKGDKTDEGLLKDCHMYADSLPKTVYQQIYQTSNFQCISNFDEDSNLNTATMDQARIETSNLDLWKEERTSFGSGNTKQNYVLVASWKDTKEAAIRFQLPEVNFAGRSVVFDVADMSEGDFDRTRLLDGEVILTDAAGNAARAKISDHAIVYPTLPVQLRKLDYVFGDYEFKHQFQTVTIPESTFTTEGTNLDMSCIVELTIALNTKENGKIRMDNVGFN